MHIADSFIPDEKPKDRFRQAEDDLLKAQQEVTAQVLCQRLIWRTATMTNKIDLINELEKFIAEYDLQKSTPDTHEWYLLNNTKKYIDALKAANTSNDVKNAATAYGMFCTESMDWDTELYKKCAALTEMGYKLVRANK